MVAEISIPGMFLPGDHASRPAAGDVGIGALYACSTHTKVYQSDGSSWSDWFDPTGLAGGTPGLTLIDEEILGSAGAITFSSIPNTYKHLIIKARLRNAIVAGTAAATLRVGNGSLDTGSNYAYTYHRKGATDDDATSESATAIQRVQIPGASGTANFFGYAEWEILHYANTSFYRVVHCRGGEPVNAGNEIGSGMGLWKNAANAIDTVGIVELSASTNWDTGSAAWLYGVS